MSRLGAAVLVHDIFLVYYGILLVRVIGSYFPPEGRDSAWGKLLSLCYALTEPVLRPLRRALHPYQRQLPLDFSPLALIILMSVAERLLITILARVL